MKKLLCVLMAAAMLVSLSACESSESTSSADSSSSVAEEDTKSAEDEAAEAEAEAEAENEANVKAAQAAENEMSDEEKAAEAEAENEANVKAAQAAEAAADGTFEDNVFTTSNYTLTVNDKWTLNESETTLDCTFNYTDYSDDSSEAATCFGVQTIDYITGVTPEEMAEQMVNTYSDMDGYTVSDSKAVDFNGNDAQEITLEIDSNGVVLVMRQTLLSHGDNLYAINATAVDSCYDKMIEEIDDVLSTFEFIG